MVTIDPSVWALVSLAAKAFDVPMFLILGVIDVESGFNIHALGDYDVEGHPHSFGLMQLHDQGAGHGYSQDILLNPASNIFIGTNYLRACMNIYPNNLRLAISAYNQGMAGAAERGWGFNKGYVETVLARRSYYEKEWDKSP